MEALLMTEVNGKPVAIESGRYAIFVTPDGGWMISRATETCDTCRACGCGTQQDPIQVPGFAVALLSQPPRQRMAGLMKVLSGR